MKRKSAAAACTSEDKKQKAQKLLNTTCVDEWGWSHTSLAGEDDLYGLEELDDVEVQYIDGDDGNRKLVLIKHEKEGETTSTTMPDFDRIAETSGFVHVDSNCPSDDDTEESVQDIPSLSDKEEETIDDKKLLPLVRAPSKGSANVSTIRPVLDPIQPDAMGDMSAWLSLLPGLHPLLLQGLSDCQFTTPTEVQASCLPVAINRKRDIVAAAETGSGKTLAFGIPILQRLYYSRICVPHQTIGLILTPTRELALQVSEHLRAVAKPFTTSHIQNRINIVTIVGGLSEEKQRRLLSHGADIIVATPGRLWDLMDAGVINKQMLKRGSFLVLDEADRMLEKGKFKELENVLGLLGSGQNDEGVSTVKRQTFVFSATLPEATAISGKGKPLSLQDLLDRLNLVNPYTVNIVGKSKMAEALLESRIDCSAEDKDLYLYYILCRYPGRTLVFVNSISTLRRLVPLLTCLKLPVYGLHAQMQQRQRLKNLSRFSSTDNSVLIASDVASRGLDIKDIQHVIHYHVSASSELYVHRSGRTARALQEGLSIMLISPQDVLAYRKICKSLGRSSIMSFPVERSYFSNLRRRLNLAKQIDQETHMLQKALHESDWLSNAAETLGVEIDEQFMEIPKGVTPQEVKTTKARIRSYTQELSSLLEQTMLPKGTSNNYLASSSAQNLPQVINRASNKIMPAANNNGALNDIKAKMSKVKGILSKINNRRSN